jgi:hypothetical protein
MDEMGGLPGDTGDGGAPAPGPWELEPGRAGIAPDTEAPATDIAPRSTGLAAPPPPPRYEPSRPAISALGGPMFPPPRPRYVPPGPVAPPVSDAVLAIPLGTRDLVRQALDLLTRRDAGLRGASFYIGFMLLVSVAPFAIILGLTLTLPGVMDVFVGGPASGALLRSEGWLVWLEAAAIPAFLGYIAATTDARSVATAVIGGRVEGRPLRLREAIAIARRRFWSMLGAQLLIGIVANIASFAVQYALLEAFGYAGALTFAASLVVSLVVGAPFVYVPAGIILGEVGAIEAMGRSFRLVLLRKRLAVVITLFGVLSQFIVTFGLSEGIDVIGRLLTGAGLVDNFPRPLVVPIACALVFALGTLTFLVETIAVAPAVHAFAALTHYTHGLEVGRREPAPGRAIWNPWMTRGLIAMTALGLMTLFGALQNIPGAG